MSDTETTKPPMKRVMVSSAAGGSLGGLLAWAWNFYIADKGYGPAMGPEIAAIMGASIVGPAVRWLIAWLPEPGE